MCDSGLQTPDDAFVKDMYTKAAETFASLGGIALTPEKPNASDLKTLLRSILQKQFFERYSYPFNSDLTRPPRMLPDEVAHGVFGFEAFPSGHDQLVNDYVNFTLPGNVDAPTWLQQQAVNNILLLVENSLGTKTFTWQSESFTHTYRRPASGPGTFPSTIQVDGVTLAYNNTAKVNNQEVSYNVISFLGVWYHVKPSLDD